ncbi:hypothetical protein Nmel_003835, partial [Mimus melanotis]
MTSSNSKFIISFSEDEAVRRAPPGNCKYKAIPVKTKSKQIPFVPCAKTVLELLNEASTTMPPKTSSTLTAATPRVFSKKVKKTLSTKIKASTAKPAPSDKERQRGKKVGHNFRTGPAPPLPKKKSSHLARAKEVLPKKAALAKEKVEKRRKNQLLKLSDVPEKA